jgi:hypothetical protein
MKPRQRRRAINARRIWKDRVNTYGELLRISEYAMCASKAITKGMDDWSRPLVNLGQAMYTAILNMQIAIRAMRSLEPNYRELKT